MQSYAGRLLVATPLLIDPHFWRTVILVLQHDEEGTLGIVLNRPTMEKVGDHLDEWQGIVADPGVIHYGGPVEPDVAIGLATGLNGEPTALPGVVLANLSEPETHKSGEVRIYSGYAGWGADQLEAEIAEGSWYVVDASPDDPFERPERQWQRVLRRQKSHLALVSTFPEDLSLN